MNSQILFDENSCNNVQIFILDKINDMNVIDLKTSHDLINKVRKHYNFKKNNYVTFCIDDLQYQYDKNNDNQIVTSKKINHACSEKHKNFYTYSVYSNISKLPMYLFPCTDNIDNKIEYTLEEYNINNRISLVIRSDQYCSYLYITYNHSQQVEIQKIESCIKNILSYISSS